MDQTQNRVTYNAVMTYLLRVKTYYVPATCILASSTNFSLVWLAIDEALKSGEYTFSPDDKIIVFETELDRVYKPGDGQAVVAYSATRTQGVWTKKWFDSDLEMLFDAPSIPIKKEA